MPTGSLVPIPPSFSLTFDAMPREACHHPYYNIITITITKEQHRMKPAHNEYHPESNRMERYRTEWREVKGKEMEMEARDDVHNNRIQSYPIQSNPIQQSHHRRLQQTNNRIAKQSKERRAAFR
eukprot:jgi/Psemu1/309026/fgenesh1_kg.467_\